MLSEKIFNWVVKHSFILLLVLAVSIIPLYILQFKEFFNETNIKVLSLVKDVILVVGATISTYFLYLTFQQARIANELKISEPIFDYLRDEVNFLVKKGTETLFSSDKINHLSKMSLYPADHLHKICPVVFDYHLSELLKGIEKNSSYRRYFKQLGNNTILPLQYRTSVTTDAQQLSLALGMIKLCLWEIYHHYYALFETCERIHLSQLENKHKVILFELLLEDTGNFEELCSRLRNNNENIRYLRDFIALELTSDNNLVSYNFQFNNQFADIFDKIVAITNTYEDLNRNTEAVGS